MARTSVTSGTDTETEDMFPSVDLKNPKHKAVISAAKKFDRLRKERLELLGTAKKSQDDAEMKLITLMHDAGLNAVSHKGINIELTGGRESVKVRINGENTTEEVE